MVLAVSSIGVILLHKYLWVIWIVTCGALAVVIAWPTITCLMQKQSKKSRHESTSPQISQESSAPGAGCQSVHVDASLGGGVGDSLSLRSTGARDFMYTQTEERHSDQV